MDAVPVLERPPRHAMPAVRHEGCSLRVNRYFDDFSSASFPEEEAPTAGARAGPRQTNQEAALRYQFGGHEEKHP